MLTIERPVDNAATIRNARNDERVFNDGRGKRWLVYERTIGIAGYPDTPCLIFESVCAVRRVRDYPADWRRLDALALARLSAAR